MKLSFTGWRIQEGSSRHAAE